MTTVPFALGGSGLAGPFQRIVTVEFEPQREWTITRSDGQPDDETITFENGSQWKREFTYNAMGILIKRSQWVKL